MPIAALFRAAIASAVLLALAGLAVPAQAQAAFYACFGSASLTINPLLGGCPAGSTLVQLRSYSRIAASSSANSPQNAPFRFNLILANGESAAVVQLWRTFAANPHLKGVAIVVYKSSAPRPQLNIALSDVLVVSWQMGDSSATPVASIVVEAKSIRESGNPPGR